MNLTGGHNYLEIDFALSRQHACDFKSISKIYSIFLVRIIPPPFYFLKPLFLVLKIYLSIHVVNCLLVDLVIIKFHIVIFENGMQNASKYIAHLIFFL